MEKKNSKFTAFPLNYYFYILFFSLIVIGLCLIVFLSIFTNANITITPNDDFWDGYFHNFLTSMILTIIAMIGVWTAFKSMVTGEKIGYAIQWIILIFSFLSSIANLASNNLNLMLFIAPVLMLELVLRLPTVIKHNKK